MATESNSAPAFSANGKRRRLSTATGSGSGDPATALEEDETEPQKIGSATAGRPRSVTCNHCRDRRVKCPGGEPCANCIKSGATCAYRSRLKPGLRAGAGEAMQKKIDALQAQVDQLTTLEARIHDLEQWRRQSHSSTSLLPATGSTNAMASASTASGHEAFSFAPQGYSESLNSSGDSTFPFGMASSGQNFDGTGPSGFTGTPSSILQANVPSAGSITYHDPSVQAAAAGSLQNLGSAAGAQPGFARFTEQSPGYGDPSPGAASARSFADPRQLPPDEIVRDLIELFFKHITPWAPIIPPKRTRQEWQPPWPVTVYAMVAIALRFSKDPALRAQEKHYHSVAKQHVILHAVESTSIASLQALAIIVLDLIGSGSSPKSWGLLALLTRSAIHLRLSKEEDDASDASNSGHLFILSPSSDPQEQETRRRLFWMIYLLDRYACVATGWDFAISDYEVKRRLPDASDPWSADANSPAPHFVSPLHRSFLGGLDEQSTTPFAALIGLLDLLGRAHTLHASKFDATDARALENVKDRTRQLVAALKRIYGAMPLAFTSDDMPYGAHPGPLIIAIRTTYCATLLKLNAWFAYPAAGGGGGTAEPFVTDCTDATRTMGKIARQITDTQSASRLSPFVVWSIWVASRVAFIHCYTTESPPQDDFFALIGCLRELAAYWPLASQYASLLERALSKWQQKSLTGLTQDSVSQAIVVLLDMRKTAYSAVGENLITPAEPVDSTNLPNWAVQPLLGELHQWFDMPSLSNFFLDFETHDSTTSM